MAVFLVFLLAWLPRAWAQQTPTPLQPGNKSFPNKDLVPEPKAIDLKYLMEALDAWGKTEEVKDLVTFCENEPHACHAVTQAATLAYLMLLIDWTKIVALSTYAKTAPDSDVANAVAYCYAQNMKDNTALKRCVEELNKGRGTFVQDQLGFQTGTLLATVFTVADDLALVKKYVFDWKVDDTTGMYTRASTPSTMRLRYDEIREGIWYKLGSADGTCDKSTVPSSISISTSDTDATGTKKPFLMANTLDVDQNAYLEAMGDSTLCKKLADALAIEAVQGEAEGALEKLAGRGGGKTLNEREQRKLEGETSFLQRELYHWRQIGWVREGSYPAFRDRVRKMSEDRFKLVQEMTGGRK